MPQRLKCSPEIQPLEPRQLFAFGGPPDGFYDSVAFARYRLDDGVLYVQGTGDAEELRPVVRRGRLLFENIRVYSSNPDDYKRVVRSNLSVAEPDGYTFDPDNLPKLSDVKKLVIDLGEGSDQLDLSALSIPAEIHGGTGGDTILGSMASDTIYGGGNSDAITDGGGDDLIVGGGGNDTLRSGRGADTLLGQSGDDLVQSMSGSDLLNGGVGRDTGSIMNAPDAIANIEATSQNSRYQVKPSPDGALGSLLRVRRDDAGGLFLDAAVTLSDTGWAEHSQLTVLQPTHITKLLKSTYS